VDAATFLYMYIQYVESWIHAAFYYSVSSGIILTSWWTQLTHQEFFSMASKSLHFCLTRDLL